MSNSIKTLAFFLMVTVLWWCLAEPAGAQGNEALEQAIALYEAGYWEKAVAALNQLLDEEELSEKERSEARKVLAFSYSLLDDKESTVNTFKAIVREDPTFGISSLEGDEVSDTLIRYFLQAALEVRREELEAYRERLMRTSRSTAFLRSAVLPGWGQQYQGYAGRGYVLMGLTAASIGYAVIADRAYRNARDAYARAQSDFDTLYDDYATKGDRADLALGIVGAVWVLNVIDAVAQGPNLAPQQGPELTASVRADGLRVVYCARF